MEAPTDTERSLYSDLNWIFMGMKDASYVEVEAAVEQRLRKFMRSGAGCDARGLQITLTWALPDGPEDWALHATAYKALSADDLSDLTPSSSSQPASKSSRASNSSRARLKNLISKLSGQDEVPQRPTIWHQIPPTSGPQPSTNVRNLPKPTAQVLPFPSRTATAETKE